MLQMALVKRCCRVVPHCRWFVYSDWRTYTVRRHLVHLWMLIWSC